MVEHFPVILKIGPRYRKEKNDEGDEGEEDIESDARRQEEPVVIMESNQRLP